MTQDKKLGNFTILVVDDDIKVVESIQLILEEQASNYTILSAGNGEEALRIISKNKIDLVFLDIRISGDLDGMEVLRRIKDSGEDSVVVMVTAMNTAKIAVEAMKLGALDYITKPFEPEEILVVTQKALENHCLIKEVNYFRSQNAPVLFQNIVGQNSAMKNICEVISKVAFTDVTVLITGESGTGKELVARAIHDNGSTKNKPFVAINCAGIPSQLLETELFGYEKGAFTGADRQKLGKLELASGGTLFLDEISSLQLDMQGKILRALQQREIERVGGVRTIKLDVRVIAATNVNLEQAIKEGKFREDLYYRLNVVPIDLPPLRDRKEDVPLLLEHFLQLHAKRFNKEIKGISKEAIAYLCQYHWPGNVRELENMTERLVVLADNEILDTPDLPWDVFLKSRHRLEEMMKESLILKDARNLFERDYIKIILEKTRWNQTEAARLLGVHRNTLMLKAEELGLKRN